LEYERENSGTAFEGNHVKILQTSSSKPRVLNVKIMEDYQLQAGLLNG